MGHRAIYDSGARHAATSLGFKVQGVTEPMRFRRTTCCHTLRSSSMRTGLMRKSTAPCVTPRSTVLVSPFPDITAGACMARTRDTQFHSLLGSLRRRGEGGGIEGESEVIRHLLEDICFYVTTQQRRPRACCSTHTIGLQSDRARRGHMTALLQIFREWSTKFLGQINCLLFIQAPSLSSQI